NPASELEATLRALFSRAPLSTRGVREVTHAACRFPARLLWLTGELGLDLGRLGTSSCPEFEAYYRRLRPRSATLVFSSYYLNAPASAYGHTFLRINKSDTAEAGERHELLDYGVDYSANVDNHNALIYAIKGLTGMFPGTFNLYPYYYKVREY